MKILSKIDFFLRNGVQKIITVYQNLLSPDHSFWGREVNPYGFCRYYPTCSSYAKIVLDLHTTPKALLLILRRFFRCHPFAKGGFDYVQKNKR